MTGIYFSGTGNTRHCIEKFIQEYSTATAVKPLVPIVAIEESASAAKALRDAQDVIILAYPIYYSNLPKIMRDFIVTNKDMWKGKRSTSSALWASSAAMGQGLPQGF